jgi:hypothetical protein
MLLRRLLLLSTALLGLTASLEASAHGWDDDRRGWEERQERREWREHEWREHEWREREHRHHHHYRRDYYAPPVVVMPPPVPNYYYAPPPVRYVAPQPGVTITMPPVVLPLR